MHSLSLPRSESRMFVQNICLWAMQVRIHVVDQLVGTVFSTVSRTHRIDHLSCTFPCPRIEPAYQELESKDVKEVDKDGVKVRVIAGESMGVKSQVYTRTPTMYLDFTVQPGSLTRQPTPPSWNAFVYTLEGETAFGDTEGGGQGSSVVNAHHTVLLSLGDGLVASNRSDKPSRFLLIAGQPLNEPVAQYGPFVMNTQQQLVEAVNDFRNFRNGFERARNWVSTSGNR